MSVVISAINTVVGGMEIAPQFQRELRRADDFIRLAVMSVHGLSVSELPLDDEQSNNWGLVVGSSFGPMETNFVVLDQIVKDEQTSPTYFSHSVFNGGAGYLTRIFNVRGYTATLTDFFYPFFQALSAGCQAVRSGLIEKCLVVQVESYSDVLHDAKNANRQSETVWPMGAVAWLLERGETTSQHQVVDHIKTDFSPSWHPDYLCPGDNLIHNGKEISIDHPLQPALYVSQALLQPEKKENFRIQSPNGSIELQTGKLG